MSNKKIYRFHPALISLLLIGLISLTANEALHAEKYLPPGYGQSIENTGYGADIGYKQVGEDYYITLNPTLEMPIWGKLSAGFKIPLEILAVDMEPKGTQKVPSLRAGTYDDTMDYTKILAYVRYGTHLYYKPDDLFNWSMYYGPMTNGYIGHKTIVNRYVSSYDPTVYTVGLMADINNNWGGVEVFQSDIYRREVLGVRGYVRPIGIFYSLHDVFIAGGRRQSIQEIALSLRERRNPRINGGIFYAESSGVKGSIGQHSLKRIGDQKFDDTTDVRFVEVRDPATGEIRVRAIPVTRSPGGKLLGPDGKPIPDSAKTAADLRREREAKTAQGTKRLAAGKGGAPAQEWGRTFWSRWSVGYTVVEDKRAPLELEKDGSGILVVDPTTNRPRASTDETLTVYGVDSEFRLSFFSWLDVTPYADLNKVRHINNSEGLHVGVDSALRFMSNFLKIYFRPEYREFSKNYIPVYFDQYYAVERTVYINDGSNANAGTIGTNSRTKLEYLKTLQDDGSKLKGYYAELVIEVKNLLVIEGNYQNYDGPNNSQVFMGLFVPVVGGFFLNGYYTKKGFDKANQSFVFDDRSLAAGEVGMNLFGFFYAKVSYQRTWEFIPASQTFVAKDEKTVSFGLSSAM